MSSKTGIFKKPLALGAAQRSNKEIRELSKAETAVVAGGGEKFTTFKTEKGEVSGPDCYV